MARTSARSRRWSALRRTPLLRVAAASGQPVVSVGAARSSPGPCLRGYHRLFHGVFHRERHPTFQVSLDLRCIHEAWRCDVQRTRGGRCALCRGDSPPRSRSQPLVCHLRRTDPPAWPSEPVVTELGLVCCPDAVLRRTDVGAITEVVQLPAAERPRSPSSGEARACAPGP